MAGDVASRIAVEALVSRVAEDSENLADAVKQANREVHQKSAERPEFAGMGTTITAMLVGPQAADIVHVGDSRAYLFRAGILTRVTRDHTVVERMVREGQIEPEEADHHPHRSYLERAIGVEPEVEVDLVTVPIEAGDRILLCTDGLTSMIDEDAIRGILDSEADPDDASKHLVAEAVRAGGSDNITVVVVDYPGRPDAGEVAASVSAKPPARRLRKRRWLIRGLVGLAVALTLLIAARTIALSRWYVGEDGGRVVIFRGVPGLVSQIDERTAIPSSSLPETYQQQVEDGITAADRSEAAEIVANLKEIQQEHPVAPVPSPGSGP